MTNRLRFFGIAAKIFGLIGVLTILFLAALYFFNEQTARDNAQAVERDRLLALQRAYFNDLEFMSGEVAALAVTLADRDDIGALYAAGDREALYQRLAPLFRTLQERYRVAHLYVTNPEGTIFLRVHQPERFGDSVTYRLTMLEAISQRMVTTGPELGANRMGLRAVAPAVKNGVLQYLIEVGMDYDQEFVNLLKLRNQADYTLWLAFDAAAPANMRPREGVPAAPVGALFFYASSQASYLAGFPAEAYNRVLTTGQPEIVTNGDFGVANAQTALLFPMQDYKKNTIGVVEIAIPRALLPNVFQGSLFGNLTIVVLLTLISVLLMVFYWVVVRPINHISQVTQRQVAGDLNARVTLLPNDELGQLGQALNALAGRLDSQLRNQQAVINQRTAELTLAADIGRALSEQDDLDEQLHRAVNLIRDRFDLYYVQVFLADIQRQVLTLRAGSGAVGAELQARSLRLPIGPGSINGTAAARRETVLVSDTSQSLTFRANPLLPDTRSEMALPLAARGELIGVLDLQSARPNGLNPDNQVVFELLAAQVAVAIENNLLLNQARAASQALAEQAARYTREGWQKRLDAIHQPRQLGFTFEEDTWHETPTPVINPDQPHTLHVTLSLGTVDLGVILVEGEDGRRWTEDDRLLVNQAAQQVVQHLENLRLLAEAEQARAEAEQASRRLIREAWQSRLNAQPAEAQAYVYDQSRVQPADSAPVLPPTAHDQALAAPLLVRNEPIGDLALVGVPDPLEAQALLGVVSEQLSAHLENLRLLEETEHSRAYAARNAARLRALQEIVSALSHEVDPGPEAFHAAMVSMSGLLEAKYAAVALTNDDGEFASFTHYGLDEATVRLMGELPKGKGLLGALLREGLPLRIRDLTQDPRSVGFPPHHPDMRSFLGVPLILQEKVYGRVYFTESLHGEFSADDEALVVSFAASFTGILQNSRLLARLRARARELETVAAIGNATATILDPNELLQTVVDLAKTNFGYYHVHIYLLDPANAALTLTAGAGETGRRMVSEGHTIPLYAEQSLVAQAARTRQPVAVNDVLHDPHFLPNPHLPDTRAELAVPILSGDQTLGVLDVQADKANRFTPEDINIKTVLANQVGGALQNARAFAAAEAAKQAVNALYEASASFNLVTSYAELLDALVANSALGRAEQRVELLLLDTPEVAAREAYWTASGEVLPREQPLADNPAIQQALEAHVVVVIPGATATLVAMPLASGGVNIGVALGWFNPQEVITEDDLRNLNAISVQAAVVAQNLRNLALIRQRAEDLALLTRAQQALSQAVDERQMVAGVAQVVQAFDAPVVSLSYYQSDASGQPVTVDLMAAWRAALLPDEVIQQYRNLPVSISPMNELLLAHPNDMLVIADARTAPEFNDVLRQQAEREQWQASVFLPLRAGGRWLGVLHFSWPEARPFSPRELAFYRTLIEPLAATVSARRAYVAEEAARRANERRVEQLAVLTQLERDLSSAVTEAEMLLVMTRVFTAPPLPAMMTLNYMETDAGDWPLYSAPQAVWQNGALLRQSPFIGQRAPLDETILQLWVERPNAYTHLDDMTSADFASEALRRWARRFGFASVCIVPLRSGARWQGLLLAYWDTPHALSENESFLLSQLAEPLAAIVASRRAYVQEQRTLRNVETLYRLSVQLTQAQSFEEMLRQCLEPVSADGASLFTFEEALNGGSPAVVLTAAYNQRGAMLMPVGARLEMSPQALAPAWSADTEAPYLVASADDPAVTEPARAALKAMQASRAAFLPLASAGRLTGMVVLRWPAPAPFEERDEIFYRTLATRLGLAVENRSLLQQTQKRASELAAIAQISVAVTTLLNERELFQTVADLTQQNFDVYHVEVYQLNPHTSLLELVAASGELGRQAVAAGPWTLPLDSPAPAAQAAQKRQGLFVNDLRQRADVPQHPLLEDVRSELAQPLVVGNTLLGVLALKSRRLGRFSQDDLTIKATLAAQVAVAVQNARLYDQARKRAERERQAFEIGQKIQATTSVEAALQTAIREIGQAYRAHRTEIRLNK